MTMNVPDLAFCKALPKIELHAHLSGSITRPCLEKIWQARQAEDPSFDVQDPSIALADRTVGQSIDSFFGHFNQYLYRLLSTPLALEIATRSVLEEFEQDGVVYLELRTTPRALPPTKQTPGVSPEEAIRLICGVIANWNKAAHTMRCYLILTIDRAKHTGEQAHHIVGLALSLRQEGLPVVGVDLAGDCVTPTDIRRFRPAFARARSAGMPITVHFAEVPTSSSTVELEELLSWSPRRLGHAIHVPEHIRQNIVERDIAVELCLTCNILAGMLPRADRQQQPAFADHHFGWWWKSGASISLGTDDVGVFGSPSSEEYRLAGEHFGLSGVDLINVVHSGVRGIFGNSEAKEEVLRRLEKFSVAYNQKEMHGQA